MWIIGVCNWYVVGTSCGSLVYVTGVLCHVGHWCNWFVVTSCGSLVYVTGVL